MKDAWGQEQRNAMSARTDFMHLPTNVLDIRRARLVPSIASPAQTEKFAQLAKTAFKMTVLVNAKHNTTVHVIQKTASAPMVFLVN